MLKPDDLLDPLNWSPYSIQEFFFLAEIRLHFRLAFSDCVSTAAHFHNYDGLLNDSLVDLALLTRIQLVTVDNHVQN